MNRQLRTGVEGASREALQHAALLPRAFPPAPHPFPYQGSKRGIAKQILPCFPADTRRLLEPFCGSEEC